MCNIVEQQYFNLKISLPNTQQLYYTTHDVDVWQQEHLYSSTQGLTVTQLQQSLSLESVDTMQLEFFVQPDLSPLILQQSYYTLYLGTPNTYQLLFYGQAASINLKANAYQITIHGLEQQLSCLVGQVFSKTCRTCLGSQYCHINLKDYCFTATVLAVEKHQAEIIVSNEILPTLSTNYFKYGKMLMTSGCLRNQSFDILSSAQSSLKLALTVSQTWPQPQDTCQLYAGCDRSFASCCQKFRNAINFRGEPHIPDQKVLLQV